MWTVRGHVMVLQPLDPSLITEQQYNRVERHLTVGTMTYTGAPAFIEDVYLHFRCTTYVAHLPGRPSPIRRLPTSATANTRNSTVGLTPHTVSL